MKLHLRLSRLALGLGGLGILVLLATGGWMFRRLDGWFAEARREAQVVRLDRARQQQIETLAAARPADANDLLATTRSAFVRIPTEAGESFGKEEKAPVASGFIGPSTATALVASEDGLRVEVPRAAPHAATTWVATEGAGLRVRAEDPGAVSISAEPAGADASAKPSLVDGYVVYPAVFPSQPAVSLVRRVSDEGAEDYFVYPARPGSEELSYRLALAPSVAGLHLISGTNTLELVGQDGAPRLRVNPPEGMDADGKTFPVRLAVEGCAVDTDPALPYGRAAIDPGARACTLRLSWSAGRYPATVDPTFVATGSMSKGRFSHSTAVVGTNRVLAFGASYSSNDSSAEIYDFATGTWASVPAVPFVPTAGAGYHSQLHLPDGRPVALEYNGSKRVGAYDGATNTWSIVGTMPTALTGTTAADAAVQLQNGDILTYNGSKFTASTQTWSAVPSVPYGGPGFFVAYGNTLAMWSNGGSAYSFNTSTNAYTQLPSVPFTTGYGGGVLLTDGRVLVSGQYPSTGKCAIYSASTNTWTACANQNSHQIIEDGVATLPTGAFYVGVDFQGTTLGKAESYNTASNIWTVTTLPYAAADFPAVTSLPDGRILLSGGMTFQDSSVGFNKAAILGCTSNADCSSGSVCVITSGTVGSCNTACTSDAQCGGSLPACNTTSGACVQCSASNSTQCTGTSKPFCDTGSNLCTADSSVISVVSPNGGEQWTPGSTQNITWTSSGSTNVGIDLYKAGLLVSHIVASTSASAGTYAWTVPSGTATGTDYKIAIFNVGGTVQALSAAAFSIGNFSTATTTALASSVASPSFGQAVSFTATLSPSGATGSVQFAVDGISFGAPVTVSSGTATSGSTSTLSAGAHTITAAFTGSGSYTGSSATLSLTVAQATSSVALSALPAAPVFGQNVDLTATVSGAGSSPTGTVTFFDGSTQLGTSTLAGGAATFSLSTLAAGPHSITATYNGDADYLGSSSAAASVPVAQADTSTALTVSPQPSTYGSPVTLTAAVSAVAPGAGAPDGTVTFYDGTQVLGAVALSGGSAGLSISSLGAGSHSLSAAYGGSANYNPSASAPSGQTVNQAGTAVSLSFNPASPVSGQPVNFTATVSSTAGTPDGTVTFFDGGAIIGTATLTGGVATFSIASLPAGLHSITASYGGSVNFAGAASSASIVSVQKADSATSLAVSPSPSTFGAAVSLTASVSAVSPGAGTPDGTITFFDGATSLGTAALSSGAATLSVSTLAVGAHSLTASYGGNASFLGSTSSASSQTVDQGQPSISLTPAPASAVYGQAVVLTTAVTGAGTSPTGQVTFLDGTQAIGTASLASGSASMQTATMSVGSHTLTASYAGDTNYTSGVSAAVTLQVSQAATSSALTVDFAPSVSGQTITISASASAVAPGAGVPTGALTVRDGTAVLGTAALDATGAAQFATSALAVGAHPLSVVYAGDTNFTGSTSATVTQTVNLAGTTLALTSDNGAPVFGQPVNYTAVVAAVAPGSGTATGSVTFTDGTGGAVLGTAMLDATGTATLTDASLQPAVHTVNAAYSGDASFSGSTGSVTETVGLAATTTTLVVSPNPTTYAGAAVFTATVSPVAPGAGFASGTVTFSEDTTVLGTAALAGATASFSISTLPAGTHSIAATYGGDTNFAGSVTALPTALLVNRAPSTVAIAAQPGTSVTGQQVAFNIQVSSLAGVPSGQVSLYDGATTGTPVGTATLASGAASVATAFAHAGTHPLTAVYAGDANFLGFTAAALQFAVTPAATSVTLSASPSTTLVNRPVVFHTLVSAVAPGAGTPAGTVTFTDGSRTLGTATLDASGSASLTVPSMAFGNHPVTASYSGSADDQPSQASLAGGLVVRKSPPVAGSGSAVSFDGATQSARAGDADGALDGARTVEAWFERASNDVGHAAACLVQQGSGSATVFGLCLTAARDGFEIRRGADVHDVAVDLGAGWHHVALVAGDATALYVDGLQVATLSGGFSAGHAQPLVIGAAPGASGNTDRFAGAIDEVRLWSAPRAAADVQADRQRPIAADAASLLALWRMDEGDGSALYDAASHHAVASFEGAPAWIASSAWANRTTPEERALAAFNAGYDPDGAPITVTVTVAAPHGTASPGADQIGYMPAEKFLGTDAFSYTVSNGQLSSSAFETQVAVTHIDVCKAQSDCAGGDLCANDRCVGPTSLVSASGGCSSLPSGGGSAALLPLLALAGFLLLRRGQARRASARAASGAALLVLALGALPSQASSGFALDTYEPSPVGDHFFEISDADVQGHLAPALGMQAGWTHQPLTLYSNGAPVPQGMLVRDQFAIRLGAAVPLFDRVLVDADVAMSAYQNGQTPFNGQQGLSASAFHDPRIGARVALLRGDLLSLAAGVNLFLPMGSQDGYGSDGSFRAIPQAMASGRRGQVVYAAEAGIELRKSADVSFTRTGSAVRMGLAGGWLFLDDKLQVGPELFSRVQFDGATPTSVEALLGARYQRGDFAFGLAGGGRLNQHEPGAAPARIIGQVTFTGLDFLHARDRAARAQAMAIAARPPPPPAPPVVAPAPAPVVVAVAPPPPAPVEPPALPLPAPASPVSIHDGKVELERTLRFAHDSAVLDEQSKDELSQLAEALRNLPGRHRVFIAGHSDNAGRPAYNDKLTARRAEAVRAQLVLHGVPAARLQSKGCGARAPVASNDTEEGRAQNRRVEILLPDGADQPGCSR